MWSLQNVKCTFDSKIETHILYKYFIFRQVVSNKKEKGKAESTAVAEATKIVAGAMIKAATESTEITGLGEASGGVDFDPNCVPSTSSAFESVYQVEIFNIDS